MPLHRPPLLSRPPLTWCLVSAGTPEGIATGCLEYWKSTMAQSQWRSGLCFYKPLDCSEMGLGVGACFWNECRADVQEIQCGRVLVLPWLHDKGHFRSQTHTHTHTHTPEVQLKRCAPQSTVIGVYLAVSMQGTVKPKTNSHTSMCADICTSTHAITQ